ncbi:MAG: YfhO family protein [Bacteroidales bacterium]|nr:YfhO family protein [Bacteroidales bacterium]
MKKLNTFLRPVFPELLMVVIMAILALGYMSPVFEGKTLPQGDIINAQNMARETDRFQEETGVYPGWTDAAFGGMPTYQIKSPPSGNLFKSLLRIFKFWLPGYTVAILFACLAGFYFLLRILRLNRWLALAGAIAFGLGSHNLQLIEAGHVGKIYAVAYLAPAVAGMLLVYQRKYLWGGLLTAVGLGIEIATNHVQVTYYLGIIILIYMGVEFIYAVKEHYFKHWVIGALTLFVALILAVLPNMTTVLTTAEYTQETTRGKKVLTSQDENAVKGKSGLDLGYITNWSYGIGETLNLFIPNLYGGSSGTDVGLKSQFYKELKKRGVQNPGKLVKHAPTYWGSQPFTSGPHYVGAFTIFLAILGLFLVRGPKKWWLLFAILLSFMLAWGRNFMGLTEFFVRHVPLYAKFRDVTNILIVAQFALPLLAFLGLKEWFADGMDTEKKLKKLYYATGIAGGIALLFLLIPSLAGSFTSPADARYKQTWIAAALQNDRLTLARNDAFRTLVFVLLTAGVLWASVKTKLKKEYLFAGLVLLVLIDLWSVGKRYLNNEDFVTRRTLKSQVAARQADQSILKDQEIDFRVLDLTNPANGDPFRYSLPSRFHKSVGGYHGAKLGRYQDLIEHYLVPELQSFGEALNEPTLDKINRALSGMNCYNMLNTKYIIVRPDVGPVKNPYRLGSAWFASDIMTVKNAKEEISALGTINPAVTAVLPKEYESKINGIQNKATNGDSADVIKITEYRPNGLVYQTTTAEKRLAVFSEIWYPHGWKATIDGTTAEILRANYLLRAMVIPPGSHRIEFKFDPFSLKAGKLISAGGSILVLLLIGLAVYFSSIGSKTSGFLSRTLQNETESTGDGK